MIKASMKDLNQKYETIVRERPEENIISGKAAVEYMEASTAIYRGIPVACLYMPKIFSEAAWDYLKQAAETLCGILDKVINRYITDIKYRKLFPFPKDLEELILSEAGYPRLLPIARLDIFFNEEDFSFQYCEFNADGASAMNEDREINNALRSSDAFIKMNSEYELTTVEYFDSWVREFMDIYAGYNKRVESPRVIITDFMENATPNEFIEFKKAFEKAGIETDICEIRDLIYSDGALKTPDGKKVDAVYRRAVTCDIMAHKNDVTAFIQAAKDNAACIIGHFRTQIIHDKSIFVILRRPETLDFLTESERAYILRHIPETFQLKHGNFDSADVLQNKNNWLIKPEDSYGSRGVYAGIDMEQTAWENAVEASVGKGYLLQRFCPPYQSVNIDFNTEARPDFALFNNITGMFVYNGKFQGIFSRAGRMGMISSYTGALTLATMVARERNTPD